MKTQCEVLYDRTWRPIIDKINYLEHTVPKYKELADELTAQIPMQPISSKMSNQIPMIIQGQGKVMDEIATLDEPANMFPAMPEDEPYTIARKKRDLTAEFKSAAVGFVGGVFGTVVSNLVNSVYEHFDPNSNTNRLLKAEEMLLTQQKALAAIRGVTTDLVGTVSESAQEVTRIKQDQLALARLLPKIIQSSSNINGAIAYSAKLLNDILNTKQETNRVQLTWETSEYNCLLETA